MNFYTVRDLRTHPKQIWEKLAIERELIITINGKPSALMIDINDENIEEVLASFRQSRTMRAVNKLRINAVKNKLDTLSMEEINAEINAVRQKKGSQND